MNAQEKAIHSAQFILEEMREQGKEGIAKLSQVLGYPEGVIAAALDDIFSIERKMADRKRKKEFDFRQN